LKWFRTTTWTFGVTIDAYRTPFSAVKNFKVFSSGISKVLSTPLTHVTVDGFIGRGVRGAGGTASASQKYLYELLDIPKTWAAS
jgi:hypothetical protein